MSCGRIVQLCEAWLAAVVMHCGCYSFVTLPHGQTGGRRHYVLGCPSVRPFVTCGPRCKDMKRSTLTVRSKIVTRSRNRSKIAFVKTLTKLAGITVNTHCVTIARVQKAKGQRSRSHEADDRFGGLAEASFSIPLGRIAFRVWSI